MRLNRADNSRQNTEHTGLRAILDRPRRRRLGKQTAITWPAEMRCKNSRLPVETKYRSINVWLFRKNADVVRQITRWKIIRTIDHHIVAGDNFERVLARESTFVRFDFDGRVGIAQTVARRVQLFTADVFCAVQNLPLQIAKIDIVEIDQPKFANARRREIKRRRRTESARAAAS